MIPDFLLPIYQASRKQELDLFCSYINPNDWERIESNIWKTLFTEAQPMFQMTGKWRLIFKQYFETGDDSKIKSAMLPKDEKYSSLLTALYHKSFDELSAAIYHLQLNALDGDMIDDYQRNCYHYIIREIVNVHPEQALSYSSPELKHQIMQVLATCHRMTTNPWRIDYKIMTRDGKTYYSNVVVRFKEESDLVLFTLTL